MFDTMTNKRGRPCNLHVQTMPESDAAMVTSRAVHNLEANLRCVPAKAATRQQPQVQTENAGGPHDRPSGDDSDTNASDLSSISPQTHPLQLFNNGLLGSYVYGPAIPSPRAPRLRKAPASSVLLACCSRWRTCSPSQRTPRHGCLCTHRSS